MFKRFRSLARRVRNELVFYQLVIKDPRTPWLARICLGTAVAYFASPIDIIPDFIPLVGYLDDVLIVPTLIFVGLWLIPKEVVEDNRVRSVAPVVVQTSDRQ